MKEETAKRNDKTIMVLINHEGKERGKEKRKKK